jgi:hypothetical protein
LANNLINSNHINEKIILKDFVISNLSILSGKLRTCLLKIPNIKEETELKEGNNFELYG